jgi:hypothetical protein
MLASTAFAQADAPTGFKVGDGRFHLGASVAGGYDSAIGYFPTQGGGTALGGDIVIQPSLLAGFDLDSNNTSVHFTAQGSYVAYLGAISSTSTDASHIDANVGLQTAFAKTGPVEVQLGDNLVRSDRTQNAAVGIGVLSLYNNARLALPIHPGGGALEFTPNVNWAVEFFEPLLPGVVPGCNGSATCTPGLLSTMDYSNLTAGLAARWRFLPKTAVVLDVGFAYQSYFNPGAAAVPASLLKGQLGLAGLISSKVSVLALVGWGYDFAGSGANTVIGQAEVSLLLAELFNLKFGYVRTLNPVPVNGTFQDDRGYAEIRGGVSRFYYVVNGAFDYLTYFGATAARRNDYLVTVGVGPGVKILPWLTVAATYNLYLRNSSLGFADYTRHVAMLTVQAYY